MHLLAEGANPVNIWACCHCATDLISVLGGGAVAAEPVVVVVVVLVLMLAVLSVEEDMGAGIVGVAETCP